MAEQVNAIVIGKWHVGYHSVSQQAVMMFEFTDREPLTFVMPVGEATALGRALYDLDTPGTPTPHRPS
jgi:hypothetical protein